MGGSLVFDRVIKAFTCDDALVSGGFCLTFSTTAGNVKKAGLNDKVVGIALKHTRSPITGNAVSGKKVGVVLYREGIICNLQLESDNQAISYGDPLAVTSDATEKGCVDKRDGTAETGEIIAYALEAVASNTGGVIKAILLR